MPIDLIDTIKPKNNGTFPMVEAEDVVVGKGTADEKRLPEALAEARKVAAVDTSMPSAPADDHVPSTQLLKEQLAKKLSTTNPTLAMDSGLTFSSGDISTGTIHYATLALTESGTLVFIASNSAQYKNATLQLWAKSFIAEAAFTISVEGIPQTQLTSDYIIEAGKKLQDKYAAKEHTHTEYLSTSGGTISGDVSFASENNVLKVNKIQSLVGTPIYDTTGGRGSNFLGLYTLCGYTGAGQRGNVFFTQEDPFTNWISVTTLKEEGMPLVDKYALKKNVYTKAEVDQKITSALGDIQTALAAI